MHTDNAVSISTLKSCVDTLQFGKYCGMCLIRLLRRLNEIMKTNCLAQCLADNSES